MAAAAVRRTRSDALLSRAAATFCVDAPDGRGRTDQLAG
jgi:hypothetical protein